jgi:transcriptional regulator with XRE-family HTH domain
MSRPRYKSLRAFVDAQPRGKAHAEIASDLGLTLSALNAYLGGHRLPGREVALRLSKDFGIDLAGLLDPALAQAS